MDKISDRLWKKAGKLHIPLSGAFELLPMCNFQCKMCYVRKSKMEVNAMGGLKSADWWLELAKQAKAEGLLYPLLTGGEPFLREDFQEILGKMLEMGMQVSVNSNASLVDEKMAKWLSHHVPTRINITLYGASEDSYQKLCGNGEAFRNVCNGVFWLKHYGIPIKFNTSITPQNVHDLDEIMEYARKMEVPIQTATYMFPPVRRDNYMIGKNNRLSPEKAGLMRVKADFLQNEPEWFVGQSQRYRRFVPLEEIKMHEIPENIMRMNCRAGNSSFWLDWQGNMMNCGMHASVYIPMKEKKFADAWKELVEKTSKIRYSPACAGCPNVRLCHPCIAMVYNECGDYNGRPDYLCRMNQAAAKYYNEYLEKIPDEIRIQSIPSVNEDLPQDCGLEEF
ncbi:MAG: radical SAM protein [Lachnospiraceae bacterium]